MTPWFLMPSFFQILNFNLQEAYHSIRFEKDTRYYSMRIEKDLLDDWVIIVINGRIQTKLGQIRTLPFPQFSDAFEHFCGMIQVRLKRRYHLKSYQGEDTLLLPFMAYATIQAPSSEYQIQSAPQRLVNNKTRPSIIESIKFMNPTLTQMGFGF